MRLPTTSCARAGCRPHRRRPFASCRPIVTTGTSRDAPCPALSLPPRRRHARPSVEYTRRAIGPPDASMLRLAPAAPALGAAEGFETAETRSRYKLAVRCCCSPVNLSARFEEVRVGAIDIRALPCRHAGAEQRVVVARRRSVQNMCPVELEMIAAFGVPVES